MIQNGKVIKTRNYISGWDSFIEVYIITWCFIFQMTIEKVLMKNKL